MEKDMRRVVAVVVGLALLLCSGCPAAILATAVALEAVNLGAAISAAGKETEAKKIEGKNREMAAMMATKPPDVVVESGPYPSDSGYQVMDTKGRCWKWTQGGLWECVSYPAKEKPMEAAKK